jgi:hypothetical protein
VRVHLTRDAREISRRLALLGMVVLAATGLYGAVGADAAGSYAARAARPTYDAGGLELHGHGAYTTPSTRKELRVIVCLRKRVGGRSFSVRCQTATAAGKRVSAEVVVPGCVKGSWRTTSTGEALDPKGEWVHQASARSAPFHC